MESKIFVPRTRIVVSLEMLLTFFRITRKLRSGKREWSEYSPCVSVGWELVSMIPAWPIVMLWSV